MDIIQAPKLDKKRSPNFFLSEGSRKKNEDNLTWIQRNWPEYQKSLKEFAVLILFGGNDTLSFRLRQAQAAGRQNLTPSHWSHVVLLKSLSIPTAKSRLVEISLNPLAGFGFPPETNAIQESSLQKYQDGKAYPNVAVLRVPVKLKTVLDAVTKFKTIRNTVNAPEAVARWLAYLWGAPDAPNPLQHGFGIPSAVLMEYAIGAAGLDLTPGLASRSSCPEVLWQSARWWYEYYAAQEKGAGSKKPKRGFVIEGNFVIDHWLV